MHRTNGWRIPPKVPYGFSVPETTYIRCELAFYNKLFDEEDWKCKVTLKAVDITGNKREVLCSLDKDIDVLKTENILFVGMAGAIRRLPLTG